MDISKTIEHIRQLRHEGKLNEAANAVKPLLQSREPGIVAEVIRLTVMLNKFDVANQYFQSLLSTDHIEDHCEIDLLCRLEAQTNGVVPPQILSARQQASASNWVVCYRSDKIDPTYPADIKSCRVHNHTGWIIYTFVNRCASCNTMHKIQLVGTLLIDKTYFCPRCFAGLEVTFGIIGNFLRTRCAGVLGTAIETIDRKVIGLAKDITEISAGTPPLVSYLNQDFIFMLNQIILSEHLKKCDESEVG